jgi:hypothetical protein
VKPSQEELMREAEQHYTTGGYDAVLDNMDKDKIQRLFRLHARERIKDANRLRKGGAIM